MSNSLEVHSQKDGNGRGQLFWSRADVDIYRLEDTSAVIQARRI